jgi:hypothetical protein
MPPKFVLDAPSVLPLTDTGSAIPQKPVVRRSTEVALSVNVKLTTYVREEG